MDNVLAWFIAGISTAGFVTLWFIVAYHELANARQNIENARRQMLLHSTLYPSMRDGPNEAAAQSSVDTTQMIYHEVVKKYEHIRRKPMNRIPAFVFRFREVNSED